MANGLPVISVNRTGHEPDPSGQTGGIRFWGNSLAAGPQGELLTVFPNDEEEVRVIEIDRPVVRTCVVGGLSSGIAVSMRLVV